MSTNYTSAAGVNRGTIQAPEKVGPRSARTLKRGPGRPTEEVDVGTSLPYPSPAPQADPALVWMSRVDGCPSCVLNTEPPRWTESTRDGFRGHYRCTDCGHRWSTDWKD